MKLWFSVMCIIATSDFSPLCLSALFLSGFYFRCQRIQSIRYKSHGSILRLFYFPVFFPTTSVSLVNPCLHSLLVVGHLYDDSTPLLIFWQQTTGTHWCLWEFSFFFSFIRLLTRNIVQLLIRFYPMISFCKHKPRPKTWIITMGIKIYHFMCIIDTFFIEQEQSRQ